MKPRNKHARVLLLVAAVLVLTSLSFIFLPRARVQREYEELMATALTAENMNARPTEDRDWLSDVLASDEMQSCILKDLQATPDYRLISNAKKTLRGVFGNTTLAVSDRRYRGLAAVIFLEQPTVQIAAAVTNLYRATNLTLRNFAFISTRKLTNHPDIVARALIHITDCSDTELQQSGLSTGGKGIFGNEWTRSTAASELKRFKTMPGDVLPELVNSIASPIGGSQVKEVLVDLLIEYSPPEALGCLKTLQGELKGEQDTGRIHQLTQMIEQLEGHPSVFSLSE
jgi:hypothetical protein